MDNDNLHCGKSSRLKHKLNKISKQGIFRMMKLNATIRLCTVQDICVKFIPSLHARSLCGEVRGRVMAEQSVAHVTHTASPALWARWYLQVGVQV